MKLKHLFAIFLLTFSAKGIAQMTVERIFSSPMPWIGIVSANGGASITGPVLINLSVSGKKYAVCEAGTLNLYNLDYSLWKAIPLPPSVSNAVIFFISENFFKLDGKVEYAISYATSGVQSLYVVDETGATLNTVSGMYWMYVYKSTASSTKAILWNSASAPSSQIFALPGNLPCEECGGGSETLVITGDNGSISSFISDPIPNPTNGKTRIDYKLSSETRGAKIVLYDNNGQVVNSYQLAQNTTSITIDTTNLPAGIYYYNLQTANGITSIRKVIVIN